MSGDVLTDRKAKQRMVVAVDMSLDKASEMAGTTDW